jgi:uncharacterized protein YkvS
LDNRQQHSEKKSCLLKALIWLTLWAGVAYVLIGNVKELDGVRGVIEKVEEGDYLVLLLLMASITLLALAIRGFALCFLGPKERNI